MEQLEKGTIVDVPSDDVANKLLREYGAFFERDGQEIVVSSDNAIKMNDDGTLYFKKPNGEWEEILVTGEQEQEEEVVEEEYEEEEVSEKNIYYYGYILTCWFWIIFSFLFCSSC